MMKIKTSLVILLIGITNHYFVFAQSSTADSLKAVVREASPENRVDAYQQLIISLWLNYPDTAMHYALEALHYTQRAASGARDRSIAIRLMGGVHLYLGNYDSAFYYSKSAYDVSLQTGDSVLIASAMNNIGFTYYHMGSYTNALEYLLRSLHMKLGIHQDYGLGQTYNNLGLVYDRLRDYKNARVQFSEAIRVSERLHDNNIRLYSYNNLAATSLHAHRYDEALSYFQKALAASRYVNNKNWVATTYCGLGQTYFEMNLPDTATGLFRKALALRQEIDDKRGISEVFYFLGKLCFKRNNIDSAFHFLRKSQLLARAPGMRERRLENISFLTLLHKSIHNSDSALYYQSAYIALRDSLAEENMVRDLAQVQINLQEEENRRVLSVLDLRLRRKTELTYFLSAAAFIIATFLFALYRSYERQRRLAGELNKNNEEIVAQNKEIREQKLALMNSLKELERAKVRIQEQNRELASLNLQLQNTVMVQTKELEYTNQELKLANLELDNFIYRSSHDIKGPLVRLLGLCNVALLDITDPQAKEYFSMFHDTALHLNNLFDRLKVVSDISNMELRLEAVNFLAIVETVLTRLHATRGFENIEVIKDVEAGMVLHSDSFLLQTIVFNLIENAIRFQSESGNANKFLRITAYSDSNKLFISFIDNGIGIRESEAEAIFQMFSRAALVHQTTGLGLYIAKQCVEKLQGDIALIPNTDNYTEFRVVLPSNPPSLKDGAGTWSQPDTVQVNLS